MTIWPGEPYSLGATWDGNGINFTQFSEHATGVELCLFDGPDGNNQMVRIPLTEKTDLVWHGYLSDTRHG